MPQLCSKSQKEQNVQLKCRVWRGCKQRERGRESRKNKLSVGRRGGAGDKKQIVESILCYQKSSVLLGLVFANVKGRLLRSIKDEACCADIVIASTLTKPQLFQK